LGPTVVPDHVAPLDANLAERFRDHGGEKNREPFVLIRIGLTPKLFGRVQLFQCAIALARRHLTVDWAELAIACGYFDQSHLMRDFVAFSGVSPADYKRRQTKLDRAGIHVKRHHLPLFE